MAEQPEAPAAAAAAEDAAPEGKKSSAVSSSLVRILMGVAIVVVLGGLVSVIAYYISTSVRSSEIQTGPGIDPGGQERIQEPEVTKELGTYTTIITDAEGRTFTLKTKIIATIKEDRADKAEVEEELEKRKEQIADAINEVLIGLDPSGFRGDSAKRREGFSELRAAINRAVNSQMEHKINGVLIPEFIFQ